ncbi:MAG: Bifunctional non-ous end joining protein LigD [Flaviaesturariibacter sp.]|nr:Bifunctional non-ous end joining protein LigD [Flaviaesturariibacter sp.]
MKAQKISTASLPRSVKELLRKGTVSAAPTIEPMLATLVTAPPEGGDWIYEMKWDGYRAVSTLVDGHVEIRSRNGKSFNDKYYPLYESLAHLGINAVLDGELVVVGDEGIPDFSGLQLWRSEADGTLLYYLFDLLWLDGVSLTDLPLEDRRAALQSIVPKDHPFLRVSESMKDSGVDAFAQAKSLHLEGVMAKKCGSVYTAGERTKDWLKIKTERAQELVIGGYTINEGTTKRFSALLLGIFEGTEFRFVTPVGTGYTRKMQDELLETFKALETTVCPFATVPEYNKPSRFRPHPPKAEVVWLKPRLVAEITYRELTSNGAIRQPSFKGLRPDKKPSDVHWERAAAAPSLKNHKLVTGKVLVAPVKKGRKTLLNPNEETQTRPISGNDVKFTNLSKVYWPKEGYTKRDMINYYYQVAPVMLPYMKNRPQILNRHPNGIDGKTFYQKDVKGKAPAHIETFPYYSFMDQREKEFLVCTDEASLLYIASLGCIEMNPWHSKREQPDNPDWCIIDLDPDKNPFNKVIEAALVTKQVLDSIGATSFVKTSGSTGIHISVPLGAKYGYEASKEFARKVAKCIQKELPSFTSIERKTEDRTGMLYIDFLQNRPQASVAAPYSLRPKPGAPVSMPLDWDEVRKGLRISDFTLLNATDRIRERGDIFKGVLGKGIDIAKAEKKIASLFGPDVMKKGY